MALTVKQMNFVNEYMKDMNGTAAYLRAGYDCTEEAARRAASRLLTNVDIQSEIGQRTDKIRTDAGISVQWIVENLKYVAERCLTPEPLADKEGNIIEWRFDSSGANKALETLGKYLGMFKEKIEHSGGITQTVNHDLRKLTTKELAELEQILEKSADA